MMNFIRQALLNSIDDGCIIPAAVNDYVNTFGSDRRYKLQWLARNFYKKGCSSGIIKYRGAEYYFMLSGTVLDVTFN